MNKLRDTIENAAAGSAGNWKEWSFAWFGKPHDSDNWMILTVEHRDSPLIDQSNARQIRAAMLEYTKGKDPDCTFGRASCDLVGWREHVGVRVYKNGEITPAFKALWELEQRLEEYPILDESDLSDLEYDSALQGIDCAAWDIHIDTASLPGDWKGQVFDWLHENNDMELEDCDGRGAYPSPGSVKNALMKLGLLKEDACSTES